MAADNLQPPVKKARMPGFTESFWSGDYAGGLGVLFQKLQQGVIENQQVLTIADMRAQAEDVYADRLGDIAPTIDRMGGGFARDDGASVRKAYEGVRSEMVEATKNHQKIANNIRELVVNPFSRWCDAHAQRIQNSQDDLQSKIRAHDRQAEAVKKLRSQYFNKCRLVEDLEEENKLAFQDPKEKETQSPKPATSPPPKIVVEEEALDAAPVEIGERTYSQDQVKQLLKHMLETVPIGEQKVPILGIYPNVSAGSDITDYIQKNMGATSVGYAESVGQDLVDRGFLRLIGNVGSTFANSSRMKYQWRPRVFELTGVMDKKKALARASTVSSQDGGVIDSPVVGNLTETLQAWNPLNNPYPNETPAERLRREASEADERYKAGVRRLDLLRCNLEESMMDHLKFLERCETDRLKAIRSVILDFSGAISNSIPSFQSQVDHMMLYQETINPLGDLRYLLENYRTGPFLPKVTPYENYYGSVDDQIFGVDLEARARADKKRVPLVVTAILTYLDNRYPDLDGDEARRSIWLVDVPLAATHHLRNQINSGGPPRKETLERYEIPIVASVLKLYLLELPDSIVSSQVYEIVKTIYATTSDAAVSTSVYQDSLESEPRIKALQSTLGQLRLNNIATLDAITTHFSRLIDLTSADQDYVSSLAQALAPCILRPKVESSLTMEERHTYRLIRDLVDHKEAIFGELKRQSSTLGGTGSLSHRQRAVSTSDESSRRAHMEARARAINEERQRAKSPAPAHRHRRDKSTDGSMGRFPVVASPRPDYGRSTGITGSAHKRTSLDVPGSDGGSPVHTRQEQIPQGESFTSARDSSSANTGMNGFGITTSETAEPVSTFAASGPGPHIPPPVEDEQSATIPTQGREPAAGERVNSIKRSSMGGSTRRGGGTRIASMRKKPSLDKVGEGEGEATATQNPGIQLADAPMDDDFS